MTKKGWDEVLTRFRAATNLVHDKEQLGSRYRQLKSLYGFIKKLKTQAGLGRREDGSVIATEDWWENNTKVLVPSFVRFVDSSDMFVGF